MEYEWINMNQDASRWIKSSGCCMKVLEALYHTNKGPASSPTSLWERSASSVVVVSSSKTGGSPISSWFTMENPLKMDDDWGSPKKKSGHHLISGLKGYHLALQPETDLSDVRGSQKDHSHAVPLFLLCCIPLNRCLQRRSRHSTRMWPSTGSSQPGGIAEAILPKRKKKWCKVALKGFPSCSTVTWQSMIL